MYCLPRIKRGSILVEARQPGKRLILCHDEALLKFESLFKVILSSEFTTVLCGLRSAPHFDVEIMAGV